ncbi:MAG: hypothetical protein A2504_13725 [Bdellovibrionales bacterium RIFOXYD12_FULL_39_22]|nr:MAG: hypothetical protein A2385_00450 [Bdellovibrionales bacterium RIFOXYB1_FULL_39_21]OFZ43853.1 MAG: hypothetical protein A2485_05080 [Bdellovibrionales bacterium RIFOXYC12_FULL_39_17]OFZ48813.1 MAG: hypothetical protein A2404_17765 [Bdellovibrionales bacterium RIFOXYC1_FULL_39_130]OFZ71502.1 MAG: hypothetical protein A2451_00200 [Bdellovibrionales bacterium RIFOXYC2_FULL_39_8]OFZ76546.1 MAG: hypothetical protein A2560_06430 [Bdellovibrionales bacterium RIFOXYD1_FULL_39_84]OFZ94780.1 MAG:
MKKVELLKVFVFFLVMLSAFQLLALEIDEKLTMRILRVSNSKKTILVNRGTEDGLLVGDHAKFFVTTGVVARGVLIKVAPSRSIWSVYRIVDDSEVKEDNVMSLKISSAVKLTSDATKMLTPEIPEVPGSDERYGHASITAGNLNADDKSEMEMIRGEGDFDIVGSGGISGRTLEFYFKLYFPGLSASASGDSDYYGGASADSSSLFFTVGLEKYFADKNSILHNFSTGIFYHSAATTIKGVDSEDYYAAAEFGVDLTWHFLEDPLAYKSMIPFLTLGMGVGTTTSPSATTNNNDKGGSFFYYGGMGVKYFWENGFGVTAVADYYSRKESYSLTGGLSYNVVFGGLRGLLGFSYRF